MPFCIPSIFCVPKNCILLKACDSLYCEKSNIKQKIKASRNTCYFYKIKFKGVKNILKDFPNKDEAIEYLVNETKLSKEECFVAYDIIMKIED